MKAPRAADASRTASARKVAALRTRLADAEDALRAIRDGEVDAVVVTGRAGPQVFTLEGAADAYRLLIESMNEGALTLTAGMTILYANRCFARLVGCPLERVIGGSLRRFLPAGDHARLRPLVRGRDPAGSKIQVTLRAADGSTVPAQVSIRPMANGSPGRAATGMVVTDMTDARRSEEALRALTRRVVDMQESERGRVALDLHDHVTQLLCAVLIRSQALANSLPGSEGTAKPDALRLVALLGEAAGEVERISSGLRPGVLEQLGLVALLRSTCREFADRTSVAVEFSGTEPSKRLPPDTELALYRVLQEVLRNVEQHARAHRVTVSLTWPGRSVELAVTDDGIGFDAAAASAGPDADRCLGLTSMRERTSYVGGALTLESAPGGGTTIRARIPVRATTARRRAVPRPGTRRGQG